MTLRTRAPHPVRRRPRCGKGGSAEGRAASGTRRAREGYGRRRLPGPRRSGSQGKPARGGEGREGEVSVECSEPREPTRT
eukprot:5243213-Pyramimonas_sp.AAC.1